MAKKGWTAQVLVAAAVAAGAGAAQVGLGYGLRVIVWPASAGGDATWLASLGWALWIGAGSTVFGVVAASRWGGSGQTRLSSGGLQRTALVVAAAMGSLLNVALIAVPVHAVAGTSAFSTPLTAAGYTVAGVLIGMLIAGWAVTSRPVAANVMLTAGWLWALAAVTTGHRLIQQLPVTGTHLGGWPLTGPQLRYGTVGVPGALLTLAAALIIGVLAVWPAVRRGDRGSGAASSGAAGPLLVAVTYLLLAPQLSDVLGELSSAYLIAPYAVLAGFAGSALAVALARRADSRRSTRRFAAAAPAEPAALQATPGGLAGPTAAAFPVRAGSRRRPWPFRSRHASRDVSGADTPGTSGPASPPGVHSSPTQTRQADALSAHAVSSSVKPAPKKDATVKAPKAAASSATAAPTAAAVPAPSAPATPAPQMGTGQPAGDPNPPLTPTRGRAKAPRGESPNSAPSTRGRRTPPAGAP